MQQTRTWILAVLLALATSPAAAQPSVSGGVNLDPGTSGGTSGLISGGGSVSSSLDARPASSSPRSQGSQAKAQDARVPAERSQGTQAKAQARTEARASAEIDTATQVKKPKKQPAPAVNRSYAPFFGFTAFGRGYGNTRY